MGAIEVRRTGARTYVGRTERGEELAIGPADVPGHITPGELLKLALAGCAGMSADFAIARRLGDDVAITIRILEDSDEATNRYAEVTERIELDLAGLDAQAREGLERAVDRAIASACTVQRSVEPGMRVRHELVAPGGGSDAGEAAESTGAASGARSADPGGPASVDSGDSADSAE